MRVMEMENRLQRSEDDYNKLQHTVRELYDANERIISEKQNLAKDYEILLEKHNNMKVTPTFP